eukprot:scaffold299347_cov23-Prasinocladus_malaysianus.AAC.1
MPAEREIMLVSIPWRVRVGISALRAQGNMLAVLLLLSLYSVQVFGLAPLAGGGGFARYFRGLAGNSADIATVKMALPPLESTIEFWVGACWFEYGA